jgi:hypothetical protein
MLLRNGAMAARSNISRIEDKQVKYRNRWRANVQRKTGESNALTFLMKTHSGQDYIARPGTGFRGGIGPALGFMGLRPGAGPRRALLTWFAELDLGRPICGGGAI